MDKMVGSQPPQLPLDESPTADEIAVWGQYALVTERLLAVMQHAPRQDIVATIMRYVLDRMYRSVRTLDALMRYATHDFRFDAATILRSVYDIHLQGLYILAEPNDQVVRATRFRDFATLENFLSAKAIEASNGAFAKPLKANPRFASGIAELEKKANAVKAPFLRPPRPNGREQYHTNWYGSDLRQLAQQLNYEDEYAVLSKRLSAVVHSSPYSLQFGPPMKRGTFLNLAWRFLFRVMGKMVELHQIALEGDIERYMVQCAYLPWDEIPGRPVG